MLSKAEIHQILITKKVLCKKSYSFFDTPNHYFYLEISKKNIYTTRIVMLENKVNMNSNSKFFFKCLDVTDVLDVTVNTKLNF